MRAPPPKTSAQLSAQHVPCWLKIVVSMRRRRTQRRMAPTAASVADDSIGQPHALREKGTHRLRTHESASHVSHRAHAAAAPHVSEVGGGGGGWSEAGGWNGDCGSCGKPGGETGGAAGARARGGSIVFVVGG